MTPGIIWLQVHVRSLVLEVLRIQTGADIEMVRTMKVGEHHDLTSGVSVSGYIFFLKRSLNKSMLA